MKEGNNFNIRWTQITDSTFMYGTQFRFNHSDTVFHNALMPSGIVIHEWKMMTNFEKDKTIPTLPILKKGQLYHFYFDYDVVPENGIYFKIIFKRRDNTICDFQIVKGHEADVILPESAFNYEVQMINAASESVTFRQISISEGQARSAQTHLVVSDIYHQNHRISLLNVLFVENREISQHAIRHIKNCVMVHHWDTSTDTETALKLVKLLKPLAENRQLHFIGYDARSNAIACLMAKQMKGKAFVTSHNVRIEDIPHQSEEVVIYGTREDELTEALALVQTLRNPSHRLYDLDFAWTNGGEQ
ncbi:accessory Sec system protein Asp3 [Staphylococcus ursi]|uniref:accessory Sec system protein Asp3 n=1 Tax=Staphylococcus sp. MI 10-1553 TaxID=1912064 RepID=UPI001398AA73|nr:accessory Sec system protein Asp3 [Staphylococcus sp. MI 10-1553]QHW36138.1 accessory Sec system protein Asp3 [Staphylococcus sp. MI 10-1553]